MAWIDKLVARSPIGPMQDHMSVAVECAHHIIPLVEAMVAGDAAAIETQRSEIDALEHQADEIKHEIRRHLPHRLMLAIERRDMLEMLDAQDSIADVTQDIAELVDQRNMTLPPALVEPVTALSIRVVEACTHAGMIIKELDELVETGFAGREVARVEEMISELSRIETDTDKLLDQSCRALFAIEDELGVGSVYLHQILLWIADVADYAERLGNRLRLLIAR
jgi:predicted phosphate transport protein (TIGR00153 family)